MADDRGVPTKWLFVFVIFFHLISVPVIRAKGSHLCVSVKFTLKLARFKRLCDNLARFKCITNTKLI